MRIHHIDVVSLLHRYPTESRFRYAGGVCTARLTTLVQVHTDEHDGPLSTSPAKSPVQGRLSPHYIKDAVKTA